ncbi:MAG: hypothetical protein COB83_13235 [Gammaproteobacteria bacterium]|nr:MAG: hypothetical protein COB83_13235 [Gammaproteobacteria bacterium]
MAKLTMPLHTGWFSIEKALGESNNSEHSTADNKFFIYDISKAVYVKKLTYCTMALNLDNKRPQPLPENCGFNYNN